METSKSVNFKTLCGFEKFNDFLILCDKWIENQYVIDIPHQNVIVDKQL